jgi:hypothetical protein
MKAYANHINVLEYRFRHLPHRAAVLNMTKVCEDLYVHLRTCDVRVYRSSLQKTWYTLPECVRSKRFRLVLAPIGILK